MNAARMHMVERLGFGAIVIGEKLDRKAAVERELWPPPDAADRVTHLGGGCDHRGFPAIEGLPGGFSMLSAELLCQWLVGRLVRAEG